MAAIDGGNVIRVDILDRDSRFSRFAPGALALDINSVLSLTLPFSMTVSAAEIFS